MFWYRYINDVKIHIKDTFMWIRLLLLVGFAIGLNWAISIEIKKQQKQATVYNRYLNE